jgi:hypothetical protein
MSCSPQPSKESRCSYCPRVVPDSGLLVPLWSCAAIKNHFVASQEEQTLVCGFCGDSFFEWSILSRGEEVHLCVVHKKATCNLNKKFHKPHHFRQHLLHSHHGAPGWWLESLERNAQSNICWSCILDRTGPLVLDPGLGSTSRSTSLVFHHDDTNPGGVEAVQQASCNASRTNSMHRVHSDVSEYDAQGSLLKRTITDSYTSVADDAAPATQRPLSRSGSQVREPALGLMTPQSHLSCFRCPDSSAFAGPIELTRHLCTVHSSDFVEARKHRRLENAYRKQRTRLRWALGLLSQDVAKRSNTEERDTRLTDQITKALEELDLHWEDGDDGKPSLPDPDNY